MGINASRRFEARVEIEFSIASIDIMRRSRLNLSAVCTLCAFIRYVAQRDPFEIFSPRHSFAYIFSICLYLKWLLFVENENIHY